MQGLCHHDTGNNAVKFEQETLGNGLKVVAELNPNVQSVAFGFFVRTGSRDETDEVSGVSHFLEHMVFKGTDKYSAEDVNRVFDEIGANYNASTSEEVTLFYAAVLPEYLPIAFEMFASILYPSLRDDDFNMEKQVILEEIGMYDDMPTFTAYEKLMQSHFSGHPLSRSILGSVESINAMTAEQMRAYHQSHYLAGNITLAIAGNVEWSTVVELAEKHCSDWAPGETARDTSEAKPSPSCLVLPKATAIQEHVAQMSAAPASDNPLRFAADLLTTIVGDDSNSRLYWELVEPGRAESAELSYNDYDGSATYMSFLTCNPEDVKDNLEAITKIYEDVNNNGVTAEELEQTKNKVSSRIVLRSERPMGRLSSLGGNWVYRKEYRSVQDDLDKLQAITLDDINNLLQQYPLGQLSTVALGPLESLPV